MPHRLRFLRQLDWLHRLPLELPLHPLSPWHEGDLPASCGEHFVLDKLALAHTRIFDEGPRGQGDPFVLDGDAMAPKRPMSGSGSVLLTNSTPPWAVVPAWATPRMYKCARAAALSPASLTACNPPLGRGLQLSNALPAHLGRFSLSLKQRLVSPNAPLMHV